MKCPSCDVNFNADWDDFLFSRNEVHISACPACQLRHVEVHVYGPENKYTNASTKSIAWKEARAGRTPVVEVAFDCQELYILPKIGFDYYRTPVTKDIPPSVPTELKRDFMEAHKVLKNSPRSSALLARRILEKVLTDNGHKKRTLKAQLESLANSKELSSIDIDKLQAVRNLGNISAHYIRKIANPSGGRAR